jgi:hypothetical protein
MKWTPALAKQLYAGAALTNEDLYGVLDVKTSNNYSPKGYKPLYNHLIAQSLPAKGSKFPQMMVVESAVNTTASSAKASSPSSNEHAQISLEERSSSHGPWHIAENAETFVSLLPHLTPILSTQVNAKSLVMTPNEAVSATTQTFSTWENGANTGQAPQYFPQALDYTASSSSLDYNEFSSLLDWVKAGVATNVPNSHFTWTANQTALGAPLSVRVPGGALVFYNAVLNVTLTAHTGSGYYVTYNTYGQHIKAKEITSQATIQYAVFDPTKVSRSGAKQPSIRVVGIDSLPSQMGGTTTSGQVLPTL